MKSKEERLNSVEIFSVSFVVCIVILCFSVLLELALGREIVALWVNMLGGVVGGIATYIVLTQTNKADKFYDNNPHTKNLDQNTIMK